MQARAKEVDIRALSCGECTFEREHVMLALQTPNSQSVSLEREAGPTRIRIGFSPGIERALTQPLDVNPLELRL